MFTQLLSSTDAPAWVGFVLDKAVFAALVVILSTLAIALANGVINRVMRKKGSEPRFTTLARLLRNVISYVIGFVALLQILQGVFGLDVLSLIAAAGVLGIAVGLGSQQLVKDVIAGFFILFENQFAVGDRVTVSGFTGVVEEFGLRTTKLIGDKGEIIIVANSSIGNVTNHKNVREE